MIDYVIHHVMANGSQKPKVFKLAGRKIQAGESNRISKKHPFWQIITHTYYRGRHGLEIQVDGSRDGWAEFELK